MHRPTPSYIQEIGSTLHEVGVCVNRIGTVQLKAQSCYLVGVE